VSADIVTQEFCRDGIGCVRSVLINGSPWFVATDVTSLLGYANGRAAVEQHVPAHHRNSVVFRDGIRGNPRRLVISEAGLYRLIMRSNVPGAEEIQEWVTAEVLPAIRRTGYYSVDGSALPPLPRTYAEALRELAATVERAEAAEAARNALAPRAEAWDDLASSGADYSAREAAAILGRAGIQTGQNRLLNTLRELGMVDSQGRPYARHAWHLRLRPVSFEHPHTGVRMAGKSQIRITVEGLAYLHRKLGGRQPLEIEAKS